MTEPRQLLLLRHAKAEAGDAADHGRDLAARGRRDADALGHEMRRLRLVPQHVLLSSALRTRRTFELLGAFEPAPSVQVADVLYLAEPALLLSALRAAPAEIRILLLVGHNPGLHALALHLAGPQAPQALCDGLPTCTLACFSVETDWSGLAAPGTTGGLQLIGA